MWCFRTCGEMVGRLGYFTDDLLVGNGETDIGIYTLCDYKREGLDSLGIWWADVRVGLLWWSYKPKKGTSIDVSLPC